MMFFLKIGLLVLAVFIVGGLVINKVGLVKSKISMVTQEAEALKSLKNNIDKLSSNLDKMSADKNIRTDSSILDNSKNLARESQKLFNKVYDLNQRKSKITSFGLDKIANILSIDGSPAPAQNYCP